tara:strand:+ start:4620 stop:7118 length:2499 start_codon:yes stop_codon:yes gene_type:complete
MQQKRNDIMALSEKEIQMLNLSAEKINELATSNPLTRRQLISKLVNQFKDKLKDEARTIDDTEERQAMLNSLEQKGKDVREHIKNRIKEEGSGAKSTQASFNVILKPLTQMNLYADGQLINENYLLNEEIKGKIDIRNPKPELLDRPDIKRMLTAEGMTEAFRKNVEKILQTLGDIANVREYVQLKSKFPRNKFLGAINVSKKQNRMQVYDYWADIGKKYDDFENDLSAFFVAVKNVEWENPSVAKLFEKLYKDVNDINLEYIVEFTDVEEEFLAPKHRFFNLVAYRMMLEGLTRREDTEATFDEDEESKVYGDINDQLREELESAVASSSSTEGDTINIDDYRSELFDEPKWEEDYESVFGAADPLLIYEYQKGERLIAINDEMESTLLKLLREVEDAIDDGKGISLDSSTDIENWFDELDDTTVFDDGDVKTMALPISVLSNTTFSKLYDEDKFKSIANNKDIGLDNLDIIKNFFGDLYNLLSSEDFRAEVEARTTKGRRRGSVQDYREARGTDMEGLTGSAKVPMSLNQKGEFRGVFAKFQSELQKMMDSAIDYFFDPLYSGLMPLEIPRFGSSIGSKVMQTLSLDLGLETVMSASYDTLFEGSVEEVDEGDLRAIADFLDNIFMPSVKIDADIITEGEFAAEALTEIFGKEEANNNYCAALIYHFMEDIGDLSREENDFDGKTIKERADLFDKQYMERKPFPVFALPHWLDMNQGVLTKKSPAMKTEYNRLKTIFESAQTDLPVLLHKLLKAHDAVREQLGKPLVYGYVPLNEYGIERVINKMQVDENIDLTMFEVEQIVKAVDSHSNISTEYGISKEQVYLIKANFR